MSEQERMPKELIARMMKKTSGCDCPYHDEALEESIRRMSERPMTRAQFRKMCENLAKAAAKHK